MELTLALAQLLAVVALIAFALAIVVFIRRSTRFLADSRDVGRFRRSLVEISNGAVASLDAILGPIDGVRRRTTAADTIVAGLGEASTVITGYAAAAQELRGPDPASAIRDALVGELERAERAIQMVEHGCAVLAAARSDTRAPEGQTSIKRGYLNILHARDAIIATAARGSEVAVAEPFRLFHPPNA
jgi:hypothetical protein